MDDKRESTFTLVPVFLLPHRSHLKALEIVKTPIASRFLNLDVFCRSVGHTLDSAFTYMRLNIPIFEERAV